jgi:hypothetical protein
MEEVPGTPWDIEALSVSAVHQRSIGNARDIVILDWLRQGDTRPFAAWVMSGHTPSPNVLLALAVMMTRSDNPAFEPDRIGDTRIREIAQLLPLGVSVTGKGKRTGDPANAVRDRLIAREVAKAMGSGLSREKAAGLVTDWLADVGIHMGSDNVEKAYKAHKPTFSGTKSRQSVP